MVVALPQWMSFFPRTPASADLGRVAPQPAKASVTRAAQTRLVVSGRSAWRFLWQEVTLMTLPRFIYQGE